MKREDLEKREAENRHRAKRTEHQAFCMICEKEVDLVTFEMAAEILRANYKEILEFAGAGRIHRLHNARGEVAVCSESVFNVLETRPTQTFDPDIFKTNPSSSNIIF